MKRDRTHWVGCWKEHPECAGRYRYTFLWDRFLLKPEDYIFQNQDNNFTKPGYIGVKLPTEAEINEQLYE